MLKLSSLFIYSSILPYACYTIVLFFYSLHSFFLWNKRMTILRQNTFASSGLSISCFYYDSYRMECVFFSHTFLKGKRCCCMNLYHERICLHLVLCHLRITLFTQLSDLNVLSPLLQKDSHALGETDNSKSTMNHPFNQSIGYQRSTLKQPDSHFNLHNAYLKRKVFILR